MSVKSTTDAAATPIAMAMASLISSRVAPNFFAPSMLARKSSRRESPVSKTSKARKLLLMLASPLLTTFVDPGRLDQIVEMLDDPDRLDQFLRSLDREAEQ